MTTIYSENVPIGCCDSFEIVKVQGINETIKLKQFHFQDQEFSDDQNLVLEWLLSKTKQIEEYCFHPSGIITELVKGTKIVPAIIKSSWIDLQEYERQQVLFKFLAIRIGYESDSYNEQDSF